MISKTKSNWLKLVGIVSMLIDHIGYTFFPTLIIFRLIGRIAFPIFAFQLGVGYKKTHNLKKYFLRLLGLAIISHIPYYFLKFPDLNIIFTLLAGLILIYLYDKKKYYLLPLVLVLPFFIPLDYGLYGLLTILLFYVFQDRPFYLTISYTVLLVSIGFSYQLFSLLALLFIFSPGYLNIKIPRYLFYYFYPGHLLIIYLIKEFVVAA